MAGSAISFRRGLTRPHRHAIASALAVASLSGLPASTKLYAEAIDAEQVRSAARMVDKARKTYAVTARMRGCGTARSGEDIVVCGRPALDQRYKPAEPPPLPEAKMVALGAPPVGGGVGASVTIRGCFLQKCPKPLYFLDVKALPEAAPGSDADRISKGETPAR